MPARGSATSLALTGAVHPDQPHTLLRLAAALLVRAARIGDTGAVARAEERLQRFLDSLPDYPTHRTRREICADLGVATATLDRIVIALSDPRDNRQKK